MEGWGGVWGGGSSGGGRGVGGAGVVSDYSNRVDNNQSLRSPARDRADIGCQALDVIAFHVHANNRDRSVRTAAALPGLSDVDYCTPASAFWPLNFTPCILSNHGS